MVVPDGHQPVRDNRKSSAGLFALILVALGTALFWGIGALANPDPVDTEEFTAASVPTTTTVLSVTTTSTTIPWSLGAKVTLRYPRIRESIRFPAASLLGVVDRDGETLLFAKEVGSGFQEDLPPAVWALDRQTGWQKRGELDTAGANIHHINYDGTHFWASGSQGDGKLVVLRSVDGLEWTVEAGSIDNPWPDGRIVTQIEVDGVSDPLILARWTGNHAGSIPDSLERTLDEAGVFWQVHVAGDQNYLSLMGPLGIPVGFFSAQELGQPEGAFEAPEPVEVGNDVFGWFYQLNDDGLVRIAEIDGEAFGFIETDRGLGAIAVGGASASVWHPNSNEVWQPSLIDNAIQPRLDSWMNGVVGTSLAQGVVLTTDLTEWRTIHPGFDPPASAILSYYQPATGPAGLAIVGDIWDSQRHTEVPNESVQYMGYEISFKPNSQVLEIRDAGGALLVAAMTQGDPNYGLDADIDDGTVTITDRTADTDIVTLPLQVLAELDSTIYKSFADSEGLQRGLLYSPDGVEWMVAKLDHMMSGTWVREVYVGSTHLVIVTEEPDRYFAGSQASRYLTVWTAPLR